jgi:cobalamin biosynthetic protein CobC
MAARAFGIEDARRVVATPGTELALRLLPIAIGATNATIATPTYSSHADAWRRAGATVNEAPIQQLHPSSAPDGVVVIVNPNNPDGTIVTRTRLLELHDTLQANGGWLVIDEAFIDVDPTQSICDLAGTPRALNLVALRSFGKFYGLAGVRLGFAIGGAQATERLRGVLGDWPLCADALAAGLAAYADIEWAREMRATLTRESQRLDELLTQHGCAIVGGTSLFRLVRHTNAQGIFERLLRAGILTRPFAHDSTLLRFGLPGTAIAWRRLAGALQA